MTGNKALQQKILDWYRQNQRPLPWRKNRDPYRIWISEIMLQQTTVQAVVPYYERFLKSFPDVETLAQATEGEVLKHWSGLGYYSRARNIHKSARLLADSGFPRGFSELIRLPGFGPYTARAVTSIAFDEPVGVVDGNVIRVVSRLLGRPLEWWKTAGRNEVQAFADRLVADSFPGEINQAVMDIGSTICTPTSPACLLCPCHSDCRSRENGSAEELPLKRPKREREIWLWQPEVVIERGRLAMTRHPYTPFLKGQWLPPGRVARRKKPPKDFHFRHSVTHHDIFVQVNRLPRKEMTQARSMPIEWISLQRMSEHNPTSLLQKVLKNR